MKPVLAPLFVLLGLSRFFSVPVEHYPVLHEHIITNREQDTTKKPAFTVEKVQVASMKILTITDTEMTAVEVNTFPTSLTGRINSKRIQDGEAIVVHYQ